MNKGFSTLLSVIIVGAVSLTVVLSFSVIILSSSRISNMFDFSFSAKSLTNACLELALMEIRNNINYSGSNNVNLDGKQCFYEVIDTGGSTREVRASATINGSIRKVKVNISQINPQIIASSWEEVADF